MTKRPPDLAPTPRCCCCCPPPAMKPKIARLSGVEERVGGHHFGRVLALVVDVVVVLEDRRVALAGEPPHGVRAHRRQEFRMRRRQTDVPGIPLQLKMGGRARREFPRPGRCSASSKCTKLPLATSRRALRRKSRSVAHAPRNPGCRDATACFSAASASAEGSGTEEVAVIIGRDEEEEEEA